jgi:hypothetical protein
MASFVHSHTIPQPPQPSSSSSPPPRLIRLHSNKSKHKPSDQTPAPWEEKKIAVSVDYDTGKHIVSSEVKGIGKDAIPAKYRRRVEGTLRQRDWSVSEVARRVMKLNKCEEVDGVLNFWAGRFARRNFTLLMKVLFHYCLLSALSS